MKIKEILYHGTPYTLETIDLNKGRGYKDFGKGFYLATSKNQALGMMRKKYRELIRRNKKNEGWAKKNLYQFILLTDRMDSISYKIFETASLEWVDFILRCREAKDTPHNYDIVVGPTADDDTSFCLNNYKEGVYGVVGSKDAKETLMRNLEVENLDTQVFIGTVKGLELLKQMTLLEVK